MSTTRRTRRRRVAELSWVVGVLAYGLVRFATAWSVLAEQSKFAVIMFGIVDFVTAVPYAVGTARLVTNLIDGERYGAARWGAVASASFIAPYLWLAWSGRDGSFPTVVYVALGVFVLCFGSLAVLRVRRNVRIGSEIAELADN